MAATDPPVVLENALFTQYLRIVRGMTVCCNVWTEEQLAMLVMSANTGDPDAVSQMNAITIYMLKAEQSIAQGADLRCWLCEGEYEDTGAEHFITFWTEDPDPAAPPRIAVIGICAKCANDNPFAHPMFKTVDTAHRAAGGPPVRIRRIISADEAGISQGHATMTTMQ